MAFKVNSQGVLGNSLIDNFEIENWKGVQFGGFECWYPGNCVTCYPRMRCKIGSAICRLWKSISREFCGMSFQETLENRISI